MDYAFCQNNTGLLFLSIAYIYSLPKLMVGATLKILLGLSIYLRPAAITSIYQFKHHQLEERNIQIFLQSTINSILF